MLLTKPDLEAYIEEAKALYEDHLALAPSRVAYFGIIEEGELLAAASVKCYSGHWYLRGCVVKPEYRGRGLQAELISERLEYLHSRTDKVRAGVFPDNVHSIRNIEAAGFSLEKRKTFKDGTKVLVYKLDL